MPPPLRKPADLGCVVEREGIFYAEVKARDLMIFFEGPRRGQNKQRASEDLAVIRAAATDHTTRAEAVTAMKRKADELKKEAKAERGIEATKGGHRTRVRYSDASGARKAIYGPVRYDERRAKADAEVLCEAAMASAASRAERLDGIANKAHDLKKHAATEAQVAVAVAKDQLDKKHLVTDSESEPEYAPAYASDIWDEPCPDVDVSSREACERLANQLPPPPKKARKELPPATPDEATARLAKIPPP